MDWTSPGSSYLKGSWHPCFRMAGREKEVARPAGSCHTPATQSSPSRGSFEWTSAPSGTEEVTSAEGATAVANKSHTEAPGWLIAIYPPLFHCKLVPKSLSLLESLLLFCPHVSSLLSSRTVEFISLLSFIVFSHSFTVTSFPSLSLGRGHVYWTRCPTLWPSRYMCSGPLESDIWLKHACKFGPDHWQLYIVTQQPSVFRSQAAIKGDKWHLPNDHSNSLSCLKILFSKVKVKTM